MKCPEGVYIHGVGGACTVQGVQTYEWLSRLAPHLTGERTLGELVGSLTADQRAMVERLVGILSERRFVVDAVNDEPHLLDGAEQRIYAAEIAFIRYRLDSAERRFQRVRQARIALVGGGPVVSALLAAGLWSGWRDVRVLAPGAQVAALGEVVQAARRDPRQVVALQAWPGCWREQHGAEEARWTCIAAEVDVVLQVRGAAHRADLIAASQACVGSGTAFGQVLVGPDEVWWTPVGAPDEVAAESCWRRLAALRGAHVKTSSGGEWLTGPVPDIVAAQVALSCFSHLTGLAALSPPERGAPWPVLTRVDLCTLAMRTHRVRPHPLAGAPEGGAEADARALIDELARGAPVAAEDLLERAGDFIDARTGLLGVLDEADLVQVPLSVCQASVSDPYGVLPVWAPAPRVMGWGTDQLTARLRTLLAALATYGSLATGPATGQGDTVWGLDLVTGQPRAVAATMAYPVLRGALMPYRATVGAAAGRAWSDAVAAGLRAHCEALLIGSNGGGSELPWGDLAGVVAEVADEQLERLLRLVRTAGRRVRVGDLSGVLGLPAFAFRTKADPVVLTCATTRTEALRDGLERVLLRWQSRTQGLPSPGVSTGLCPLEPAALRSGGPEDDPRCQLLTGALRRAGRVPVAVPIIQDRQARNLLPYVVQVVLCDAHR